MNKLFFLFSFLLIQTQVEAQTDTIYFSKNYKPTAKDSALYYRVVLMIDTSNFQISHFFINGNKNSIGYAKRYPEFWYYKKENQYLEYYGNGNLKESATFKDGQYLGVQKEYFSNGKIYKITFYTELKNKEGIQMQSIVKEMYDSLGIQHVVSGFGKGKEYDDLGGISEGLYKNGLKDSIWIGYYKNGKIYYSENYLNGELKKGISYDTLGNIYNYETVFLKSEFQGGQEAYMRFLQKNLAYPAKFIDRKIKGKVVMSFVIEKDGSLKDFVILKEVDFAFSQEALRVIMATNGKWTIAQHRGIPVRFKKTITVIFAVG